MNRQEPSGLPKPDAAGRLRDLLVPFAASSAEEPGCLGYAPMEVEDEPGRFPTHERWTDHAAAALATGAGNASSSREPGCRHARPA